MEECLKKRGINVHSVQHRTKDLRNFGRKAALPSEVDPNTPKYPEPIKQITDLAGIRIITHFPGTLTDVDRLLSEEFDIVERSDKGRELIEEERFGYQSIHYLCVSGVSERNSQNMRDMLMPWPRCRFAPYCNTPGRRSNTTFSINHRLPFHLKLEDALWPLQDC